jgi:hypothetical protein
MSVAEKTAKATGWQNEMESIRVRHNGVLRPSDVVEYARDSGTALHDRFTWDDSEAADQYRLWQARELIAVVVTLIPGADTESRAYVSMLDDREKDGGGYRSLVSVLSETESRKRLVAEALAEFDRWKAKYEMLKELASIFAARHKVS